MAKRINIFQSRINLVALLLIIALSQSHTLLAQTEIIVKGLTAGRAILSVDGQLLILREGQTENGIKLISANNQEAVLQIGGKKKVYGLDRSIAQSYKQPEPTRAIRRGSDVLWENEFKVGEHQTTFLQIKLANETDNSVMLKVEYAYAGDYGEEVFLSVITEVDGQATPHAAYSLNQLSKGKHTADFEITMAETAPAVYRSDKLKLSIIWSENDEPQGEIVTRTVDFAKYWKRVRVR